jgi:hypothetical protein
MTLEAEGLEERRNILLKYLKNEMPDGIPDRASFFDVFYPYTQKNTLKYSFLNVLRYLLQIK